MSKWHATFAMTVLPLNSVINPLIYHKALGEFVAQKSKVNPLLYLELQRSQTCL